MKYALVNNLREEPKKGLKGFCPFCNDEVIPKVGQGRKIPHWAHKNIRNCDLYKGEETAWHRNWKNQYPESFQERIVIDTQTGQKHRADILTPDNLVIEFQYSPITSKEKESRERIYKTMIWVVNCVRLKNDLKRFNKNKKYLFQAPDERSRYIVYPKYINKVFPKDWISCEVPVIFDFAGELINDGKNKLYCLFPMRSWYYEVFEISCLSFISSTKKSIWINKYEKYINDNRTLN